MELPEEQERRRARAEREFAEHDRQHGALQSASIDSANHALKALLLLNGGASVALLGFLASTFGSSGNETESSAIIASLRMFAWGSGAAVLSSTLAYLCNSFYAGSLTHYEKQWTWPHLKETPGSRRRWWWGRLINWIAVGAAVVSLLCFGAGVYLLNELY